MSLAVATDPTPIRIDADGTVRVAETNVRLQTIVHCHQQGYTPERIHESFPSVSLPDVYGVVSYYLRHKDEVDAYIAENEAEADRLQEKLEAEYPTRELRTRLKALRDQG